MGNHYKRLMELLTCNFQQTKNITTCPAIQIACRFICKYNSWFGNKGAGNRYTLLLAAGQIVRHTVQLPIESQHFHDFIHKPLVHGITIQLHRQDNIFIDI